VLEGFALLELTKGLEAIFWDAVAVAFRWPFYTAGIAALLALIPSALLPRRLTRRE